MTPDAMCAVLLTGHGGPDKLVYRDDVPAPAPGAGEVLIEVSACGVNNTDIFVREGAYGTAKDPDAVASYQEGESTLKFPRIQGADIAGHIVSVGQGVSGSRVGERVMVDFNIYGGDMDDYIGHGRDGGFAEYATAPADQARVVDTDMTDIELATFCCAYLTGERMLNRVDVRADERVLVTGASGGVGSGVVQLCRARGAVPYAIASQGKGGAVLALGAEAVIARDSTDLEAAVTEATGGAPIDVVVDVVAGPMFGTLLNILRREGRYVTCGAIGGPIVEVDLRRVYLKHLQIHGSTQSTPREFDSLVSYIEEGKVAALVGGVYKLSDIHRAQSDFKAKNFVGNLVVVPDSKWDGVVG